jgi:hypothetical protein
MQAPVNTAALGRFGLAAAFAVFAALPAAATIHLAGKTLEETARIQALAHQAGRQRKETVGITYQMAHWPGGQTSRATGVYLGLAEDGRTGLVLTAAHSWIQGASAPGAAQPVIVVLHFGPSNRVLDLEDGLSFLAKRVVLHPDHRAVGACAASSSSEPPNDLRKADLAMVEFDLPPAHAEALKHFGVRPARLYQGTGYRKPLLEGLIAGFGLLSTQDLTAWDNQKQRLIHAGHTRVSHRSIDDRTGFYHWSPLSAQGVALQAKGVQDPDVNADLFALMPKAQTFRDGVTQEDIHVQSHARQALFAQGDSGGPLYFNTSAGLALAGICSYSCNQVLISQETGEGAMFIRQMWEPLMGLGPWLEAIRRGDHATSVVLAVPAS